MKKKYNNNKINIIIKGDALALAKSSRIKTSDFLKVASYYENEEDYLVLSDLAGISHRRCHRFLQRTFLSSTSIFLL